MNSRHSICTIERKDQPQSNCLLLKLFTTQTIHCSQFPLSAAGAVRLLFVFSALALSFLAPGLLRAAPEVQIFVLHSYSQEYPWTRNQHAGFQQALEDDQHVDAVVSTEYLDTKRHAYDEAYASEMARHFRTKYQDYKPAAIYVTDDSALLFARDHLSRIFPATPVFFSGVNDYGVQASLDSALFTGVFERQDVARNVELLLSIDKEANDIVYIGDGSSTFQAIEREARTDLLPFHLRVAFLGEKRLDLAMEQLRDLPGKYIFLTTIGGMTDVNGQVMGVRAITKSIASKGRLVLSMEDTYVMEGVLGGVATSGQKQGSSAASLLLAHLHGKAIADLSPVLKSPNVPVFDDRVLAEHGIVLPDDIRGRAVWLNPRSCYYERNRSVILPLLMALAVLIVLLLAWLSLVLARVHSNMSAARKKAEATNDIFNGLALVSRTVHWKVNADGLYTYVSPAASSVLGYRPDDLVGSKHFYDLHPEDGRRAFKDAAFAVFARHEPFSNLENTVQTADGTVLWMSTNGQPILDEDGKLSGYSGSDTDITVRKQAEQYHEMDGEILHILSEAGGIDDAIRRTLGVLKKGIGCDAVGIRLQDGDDFPYFDQEGFPKSFLLTENTLLGRDKDGSVKRDKTGKAILECTCGLVLSGKTDKDNPLFTRGGSFWTNDSIKLLDLPSDQDPGLNPRNQCMHHGYASMALIPIRNKGRIVGLIHIDDRRKGLFCFAAIEQLEDIVSHVGEVMARRQAEAQLKDVTERLSLAVRTGGVGVWDYDVVSGRLVWDDKMLQLYGMAGNQFDGVFTAWQAAVHTDDRERIDEEMRLALDGIKEFDTEFRILTPAGNVRNIRAIAVVRRDASGRPVSMTGTNWDITSQKSVEEALRASETNFRAFFETMTDIVVVYTMAGQILFANSAVTKKLGYSQKELKDMHLMDLYSSDSRTEAEAVYKRIIEGELESCSVPLTTKGGVRLPVETRIRFGLWDGRDCVFGVCKDLSEEQEAQHRFERLFYGNPSPMALSADGCFYDVNEAFLARLGYSRDEIVGKNISELGIFTNQQEQNVAAGQLLSEGRLVNMEMQVRTKYGVIVDGLFSGEVIKTRGKDYLLTVMVDITERKKQQKAERADALRMSELLLDAARSRMALLSIMEDQRFVDEELKKSHNELERRVDERTKELSLAKQAAESANQAKSNFLSCMSHELRTPLNAVIGFSHMLNEQIFGPLNPKQAEYVKDISESGGFLLELINDILDLAKVEAGKMDMELSEFPVGDLVDSSLTIVREKAAMNGLKLTAAIPQELLEFRIKADARKLKQVMFNLVSNAVKFTPTGGAVRIVAERRPDAIVISVADTGVGIAMSEQERIFDEFYQVQNREAGKAKGTGLGLGLARRFVSMHGGKIWVDSAGLGKGSKFSFSIPVEV